MGKRSREKPARLGEKLLQVRNWLGLSQTAMWKRLELQDKNPCTVISGYENGTQEPSLITLLKYAQFAGISTDALIDDEADLPARLLSHQAEARIKPVSSKRKV